MNLPKWLPFIGRKATITDTLSFVQYLQQLKSDKVDYYTEWVYAGFYKIAQSLARVEWELYQLDNKGNVQEVDESSPLLALLYKFNPNTTRFDAMCKTILGFLLDGEVGWYKERTGGKGKPTKLFVIPKAAYSVEAKDQFGNPISYKIRTSNTEGLIVSNVDFLVIKNTNPMSNEKGFSVLDALRDVSETDWFISRWNKNLMKNDAQPSALIEMPADKKMTPDESALLKKEIQGAMSGYENSHKIALLLGGAKLTQTALNPKDLDFNNGRSFNRDLILAVIGTPKTLLGLDNGVTKATAETAERIFAKYTLEPILEQVTEWLNEYLVPEFNDRQWLGYTPLAQEDREQLLNELDKGYNRWLTINETRAMVGKDPVNGGDMIYMPLNVLPMVGGTQAPQKGINYIEIKGNPVIKGVAIKKARYIKARILNRNSYAKLLGDSVSQKVADALDKKNSGAEKKILKIKPELKSIELGEERKKILWDSYIAQKRTTEQTLKTVFEQVFARQKQTILNNLKAGAKQIDVKAVPADVLFDLQGETQATISIISPQLYNIATEGLKMAGEILGVDALTVEQIPALMDWITKIADKYGTDITQTTYDQLTAIFQSGMDSGSSIYDLGNAVEDYFGNVAPARADMIARTESARAMTASEAFAWDGYGIKKVEWYLAGSDPCDICVGNSVKSWSVEEAQKGIVNYAHPNCECLFLPL